MSAEGKSVLSGPWASGVDSWSDSTMVADGYTRWNANVTTRGGCPRTRPGNNVFPISTIGKARGFTIFTPNSGIPHMIAAIGSQILKCPYPFTDGFTALPNLNFGGVGKVYFTKAVQNAITNTDGSRTIVDPLFVLMIYNGESRTAYWDGSTSRHLDPTKQPNGPSETPVFERAEWSGGRFWGSYGNRVRASDLADPLHFTEEDFAAESGVLTFPDNVTAMTRTADFKNLLVYTNDTTSSVQTNITDRPSWEVTPGFQTEIFPNLGCAAGKSPTTQYGITWWYAQGGLIGLDQALQTYRSSRLHFQDQAMNWSKTNLSPDISGICMGTFENYLLISAPSGDIYNAHTWILDESWQLEQSPSDFYAAIKSPKWDGIWTGLRPVEFCTATINGKSRCFCLSQDYAPNGSTQIQNNVWELFNSPRLDVGVDQNGNKVQKKISCSVETKVLGGSPEYKDFRYIEVDCEDIEGVVDVTVSFAPIRGGYKQVQSKQFVASQWNVVNGQTTISVDTFQWNSYRSQDRILRSEDDHGKNDSTDKDYEGVESTFPRQTDMGFSVLVQWTGSMSVRRIKLVLDDQIQPKEGETATDETTDRHVQMSGFQEVDQTSPPTNIDGLDLTSSFVTTNNRRWVESGYSSLS